MRIQREHGVPVVIEGFESLGGRPLDDAARRRPRPLSNSGIYVLVAGRERDAAVRTFRAERDGGLSDRQRAAVREAFLAPLLAGDPDLALEQGVRAIEATVAASAATGGRSGRDLLTPAALVAGALAALLAIRRPPRYLRRRRRRCMRHAGAVDAPHVRPVPARARLIID